MSENVCICTFLRKDLFADETHTVGNITIDFLGKNTPIPDCIQYELAVVVCDFDFADLKKKFTDSISKLDCKHLHLFCIGKQQSIRNFMEDMPPGKHFDSFSVIVKDENFSAGLVEGMVCNFITPLCTATIQPTARVYGELYGPLEIIATENLPDEDVCDFVTSHIENEENIILSVIGKNYSRQTIADVENALPDCKVWSSADLTKSYNMILVIRPLDEYHREAGKRRKQVKITAPEDPYLSDLRKELELKFNELFGSLGESDN